MPGTQTRATSANANLLLDYLTVPLNNLEPMCHYAAFGTRRDVPAGYNMLNFPKVTKFATSDIGTIGEGIDPVGGDITTDAFRVGLTQLGDIKVMSDLLIRNIAIDLLDRVIKGNQDVVVRSVDDFIQTVVNSSSNVIYPGGKLTRAALGPNDKITVGMLKRAVTNMKVADDAGMPMINGAYVAIVNPTVISDIKVDATPGSFTDVARYMDPQALRGSSVGTFEGLRFLETANQHKFVSNVDVHSTPILGEDSFGWGYFQTPMPVLLNTPDSANPLNLRCTIGVKFSLGAVLFESFRMVRIESAYTPA